jgi:hypothetical protein
MMTTLQKTFDDLVSEFRTEVHGALAAVRARVGGERQMLELRLQADGVDPELSAARWVHFAHIGTLDKLELMFKREGEYGTFELLAIARNVFENLVWLRFLNRDFRNGLIFYAKFLDDTAANHRSYLQKVADEADLFDHAEELDDEGLISTIGSILDDEPGSDSVAAAQEEHRRQTAILDDMVRREFSLFAAAAAFNSYALQAIKLRDEVIPDIERKITETVAKKGKLMAHLASALPSGYAEAAERSWKWREQAERAGMLQHYEFLYRLTSKLLHSTPLNIITEKALSPSEAAIVMDYIVVASLDLLQEMKRFDYPGRMKADLLTA